MTPSEIADHLQEGRPHLEVQWEGTGGGVMCIVAHHKATNEVIYVGTANGCLGFSDETGELFGDAHDLLNTEDQVVGWDHDRNYLPDDSEEVLVYVGKVLDQFLPPAPICGDCGYVITNAPTSTHWQCSEQAQVQA